MATSKKKTTAKPSTEAPKEAASAARPVVVDDTKKANALLLSCMDLRVIDETAWLMQELGHHNKYDHVAIAGSALGVLTASYRGASQYEAKKGVADIRHF